MLHVSLTIMIVLFSFQGTNKEHLLAVIFLYKWFFYFTIMSAFKTF